MDSPAGRKQRKLTDFTGVKYSPSFSNAVNDTLKELDAFAHSSGKKAKSKETPTSKKRRLEAISPPASTPKRILQQAVIDANQKVIGARICAVCKFVGDFDDETDRKLHEADHAKFLREQSDKADALKFTKSLLLECDRHSPSSSCRQSGTIVAVTPPSASNLISKARDCLKYAESKIGSVHIEHVSRPGDLALLFINEENFVVGCLSAETVSLDRAESINLKEDALPEDSLGETGVLQDADILCGILLVWVSQTCRRKGIARSLLQFLRQEYKRICLQHGSPVRVAYSEPTDDGLKLIGAFETTNCYLRYTVNRRFS